MKHHRSFILCAAALIAGLVAVNCNAQSGSIIVPGRANPWFAGQPDGSGDGSGDVAPDESPVLVSLVDFSAGDDLAFAVTGSVSYGGTPTDPPDGDAGGFRNLYHLFDSTNGGPENGIAGLSAPANSLIGVFLGPDAPVAGGTPAPFLNFASDGSSNVPGTIDYTSLAPALAQPFFIGDGRTSSGAEQRVKVPAGATRLLLGTMDGSGWYNNSGAFSVKMSIAGTVSAEAVVEQHFAYYIGVPDGFDSNSTSLTYSATGLPSGFVLDPKTGVINGIAHDGSQTTKPIVIQLHVADGSKTFDQTLFLTISDGVPRLTVNDSAKPSYPDASATPVAGLADQTLTFAVHEATALVGRAMFVQATTTPDVESSWKNLSTAGSGFMPYDYASQSYVLGTTNYPAQSGVYFRARLLAPGHTTLASNIVGPFDLTSSTPRLGTTALYITRNGLVSNIRFGVTQSGDSSGVSVRIQSTKTPTIEGSWADAGNLQQDPSAPNEYYLGLDDYPPGEGIYFRAVATGSGPVPSLSAFNGPYQFIQDPAPTVSITLDNGQSGGSDYDFPLNVSSGSFNVTAEAQTARSVARLDLIYDGDTLEHFSGSKGTTTYTTNIIGDHLIEATATDDLNIIGHAIPVHVRVAPVAPGKLLFITSSGNWSDPNIWTDAAGNHVVPGPDDFAVLSDVDVTLTSDVTVGAVSLNGGTISGAKLSVQHWCTIGAGTIKCDMDIADGASLLLINDTDIRLGGRVTNFGRVKFHGKAGVTGIPTGTAKAQMVDGTQTMEPNIFSGIVGFFKNLGQAIFHPAAGGRRGSVKSSPPAPAFNAPEVRTVTLGSIQNSGKIVAQGAGNIVAQGAGNIVAQGGGNIVAQGAGNIVAQGAGNLYDAHGNAIVAQGAGNIVAQGAGNIVAQGAGNIVAQGAGNIVAQGAGNIVAQGAGNIVAVGAGNIVAQGAGNLIRTTGAGGVMPSKMRGATAPVGVTQSGGELDLNQISIDGSVTLDGGVLTGSGCILGDLNNNNGFINVGHSAGVAAVTGEFAQGSGGTVIVEEAGAEAGLFDVIQVGGNAQLGGRIDVRTVNGYVPLPNDPISPMGFASATGSFTSVSSNAQLSVVGNGLSTVLDPAAPNPRAGQPLNISTRMEVLSGENVLIAGFIVTGPAGSTKKVLIRGLGPSLPVGSAALADPLLEFHNADGSVTTNDDWKSSQESDIEATGIPPSNEKEAAMVLTIPVGSQGLSSCTAILKGANGETGIGLVEVYDLDQSSAARLANISTRGFIDTGDNVMIGGFIVGGGEPAKMYVRAVGPSLQQQGVNGAIADPMLELHDANGAVISNDDWRATQEGEVLGTSIPPTSDQEPAIVQTLVPGNYTAVVRGKNNTTGVGLVEAYNLQ